MQCNTIGFLLSGSVCFKLSEVINVEAHAAHGRMANAITKLITWAAFSFRGFLLSECL